MRFNWMFRTLSFSVFPSGWSITPSRFFFSNIFFQGQERSLIETRWFTGQVCSLLWKHYFKVCYRKKKIQFSSNLCGHFKAERYMIIKIGFLFFFFWQLGYSLTVTRKLYWNNHFITIITVLTVSVVQSTEINCDASSMNMWPSEQKDKYTAKRPHQILFKRFVFL